MSTFLILSETKNVFVLQNYSFVFCKNVFYVFRIQKVFQSEQLHIHHLGKIIPQMVL